MSLSDFQNTFQIAPIYLVAGIAGQGQTSIDTILNPLASGVTYGGTGSASTGSGATTVAGASISSSSGSSSASTDVFGVFTVLPGGTLIDNEIAHYPLANQATAANAVITNPLRISVEMLAPAYEAIPFSLKRTIFTALKSTLDQHTALGGYYMVYTPAFTYNDCLLETLVDASEDERGGQPQVRWVWTFEQPLITVQQSQAAQAQAAARITNGNYNSGDPPGSNQTVTSPSSVANQVVIPSPSYLGGAGQTSQTPANLSSVSPILPGGF